MPFINKGDVAFTNKKHFDGKQSIVISLQCPYRLTKLFIIAHKSIQFVCC